MNLTQIQANELETTAGATRLTDALMRAGAAVVVEAIPPSVELATLEGVRSLFDLPLSEKLLYAATSSSTPGYAPYGQAHAIDTGIANLLESWKFSQYTPEFLPDDKVDCWYSITSYYSHLRRVSEQALLAVDRGLAATGRLFSMRSKPPVNPQFLYYFSDPVAAEPEARRQSIHVDSSLITLLPRATRPGLIMYDESTPHIVDIPEGSVLVIAGSILEFMTSSKIKALSHTVEDVETTSADNARISALYFVEAASGEIIPALTSEPGRETPTLDVDKHNNWYAERVAGPTP